MTLELIVFIASILLGILLYWRESNGNGFYRFINKLVNSKELQMKPLELVGLPPAFFALIASRGRAYVQ